MGKRTAAQRVWVALLAEAGGRALAAEQALASGKPAGDVIDVYTALREFNAEGLSESFPRLERAVIDALLAERRDRQKGRPRRRNSALRRALFALQRAGLTRAEALAHIATETGMSEETIERRVAPDRADNPPPLGTLDFVSE